MVFSKAFQARSFLYAKTQLRAHRRAGKKIKSKKNMEDYQSQSPCRHAKTVLESFFVLCVYRPHDNGIGVASDQIRKSLLCTVSASSCYRKYYFTSIDTILCIMFTMLVTSATAKRSFSVLRRLKTYVQSTMNNDRLSSIALMHIHRDFSVDLDKVMEKCVSAKTRRTDFGQF